MSKPHRSRSATVPLFSGVLLPAFVLLCVSPPAVAVPVAEFQVVRPVVAGQSVSAMLDASGVSGSVVYEIVSEPDQGAVILDDATTGAFTYLANPDAKGRDSFSFQVTDATETSAPQEVHLTVHPGGRRVVAVGSNTYGETNVSDLSDIVAVAACEYHTVALKSDGTVQVVGDAEFGKNNVGDWADVVAVAAGLEHTVGVKSDGKVMAVGLNDEGQINVGAWTDIVAVAAGWNHTVGLKSDGTAVAVGLNDKGQINVGAWSGIVAVAAAYYHTVGLKSDGTVVAVGLNDHGQANVSGWSDISAVAAGTLNTVGLKSDGTVVVVGDDGADQTDVSGWSSIVGVTAGKGYTIGLKSDGMVVAVGSDYSGQTNVSDWRNILAVVAGGDYTVGVQGNAAPTFVSAPSLMGSPGVGQTLVAANIDVMDDDDDAVTLTYQWQRSPDNVSFADITDANGNSYTLAADDAHAFVRVVVTADDAQPLNHSMSSESTAVYLPNSFPMAVDDANVIEEGGPVSIDVLANDADADGDLLIVSDAPATTAHGATVVNHGTHVTYTPAPGWSGIDSFSYAVSDGYGGTATAKVMIGVLQSTQPPTSRTTLNGGGGLGADGAAMLALLALCRRWWSTKQD